MKTSIKLFIFVSFFIVVSFLNSCSDDTTTNVTPPNDSIITLISPPNDTIFQRGENIHFSWLRPAPYTGGGSYEFWIESDSAVTTGHQIQSEELDDDLSWDTINTEFRWKVRVYNANPPYWPWSETRRLTVQ